MTAEEFAVWAEARPEKHWELFDGSNRTCSDLRTGVMPGVGALHSLLSTVSQERRKA